jgi:hypothetical protein
VTGRIITVRAQWALHGKVLDDEGYHVIACSNGDLSKANFHDAISRFALGALETLPQVSISYLQPATRSPGGGYLALSIHWFAENGQRYADGVLRFDNQGRHTAFTSYFCAPYAVLTAEGITYLDMYRAFGAVTLPAKDGPPRDVTLPAGTQQVPAIDGLAMRVAPLLLTGVPVCVLGADETSLDDRLRFIDTVMGLLPYGFRARMTAATWTRATNRDHRFRLFFSSEPRKSEKPDHLVTWGEPELTRIPGGDAGHYYRWLADKVTPLASLAQLRGEASFGDAADTEALRLVDEIRLWRRPRLRPAAPDAPSSPDKPDNPQPRPATAGADPMERLLRDCIQHVLEVNLSRLRQDLTLLQNLAEAGGIDDSHRRRYRALITRHGLLRPNGRLGKYEGKLYEMLLAVAFSTPVSYEALCQVEDCLHHPAGTYLPKPLLEAIERAGLADLRMRVLVYSSLDARKLAKWLSTKEVDAYGLIGELAQGGWRKKEHGRLFCDATLKYLQDRQGRYSPAEIRRVLSHNGYLAQALRDIGHDQYQVYAITLLLLAAFPKEQYPLGLDRATINEILADRPDGPTPALLAALLRRVPAPDAPMAWSAYVYGSVAKLNLDETTHGALWTQLPAIEPEPESPPSAPETRLLELGQGPGPEQGPRQGLPPWESEPGTWDNV